MTGSILTGASTTGAVTTGQGVGSASEVQAAAHDAQQKAKLAAGAHEFEAMMLQEMLKPLKFGQAEGGDEEATGASGTVQGFATDAIAKGIASKGGLGIAAQIIRQVSAEHDAKDAKKVGTKVW